MIWTMLRCLCSTGGGVTGFSGSTGFAASSSSCCWETTPTHNKFTNSKQEITLNTYKKKYEGAPLPSYIHDLFKHAVSCKKNSGKHSCIHIVMTWSPLLICEAHAGIIRLLSKGLFKYNLLWQNWRFLALIMLMPAEKLNWWVFDRAMFTS